MASRPVPTGDLVRNTLTNHAERVLDGIVLLLLFPLMLQAVGVEMFGLWNLIWAAVGMLALVEAGFQASVVKYVADARGRDDRERFQRVVATLFWVFVAQTLVVILLVDLLCLHLDGIFNVPPHAVQIGRAVLLVLGTGYAFTLPLNLFRGILIGSQRVWVANLYRMGGTLLYAVLVWVGLTRWPDLRVLAVLSLLATALPPLLMAAYVRRHFPSLRLGPGGFDPALLREVWSFSSCFLLIQVAGVVATRASAFVVAGALPLAAVAIYAIAMRVSTRAGDICAQISRALSPVVAELHGAGEDARLRQLWLDGSRISVAFAAPLLVGCLLLAEPLVTHWVGAAQIEAARVLQILLVACMIEVVHFGSLDQLSMRGEQRFLSHAVVGGQALNLALAFVLVRAWGLTGVAFAALVVPLVVDVWLVQRRLRQRFGLSRRQLYAHAVLPSLAPLAVMLLALQAWQMVHPIGSLLEVALAEMVAVGVFWAAFWRTGLDPSIRARVIARFVPRRAVAS